jgi:pimeloyl-ACP methyl ester carboxylesterase
MILSKHDPEELLTPEIHEYALPSTFHNLPIRVREIISPEADTTVIYAHGSYDNMDGHGGFYSHLFYKLAQEGICSSVSLTTARDEQRYNQGDYLNAFRGKQFQDELTDVNQVISDTIKRKPNQKIIVIGLSLGGTLATISSTQYADKIKKLILISSGNQTQNGELELLHGYPDVTTISTCAAQFKGELVHISPLGDLVVPNAFQDSLFQSFVNAQRTQFQVPNTDHTLSNRKDVLEKLLTDAIN